MRSLFLILCFFPAFLIAQVRPALMVKEGESSSPLRMDELKVDVRVIGKIARTTLDMTFSNETDRILEGQLYFPLGEGQTVSRFAMDVNGKLREGVVVPKEQGQAVFESVVRRNIDPGLLEWTKGNNFKARVYPIPAKGYKRIVVAYEQELQNAQNGLLYTLPMNYPDPLKKFALRIEVFKQSVQPELQGNDLVNLDFERWEENWVAELERENYRAQEQIGVLVPKRAKDEEVFIESLPEKGNYFYFNFQPEIQKQAKEKPKSICLLWDVSNSAAEQDRAKNLALLDQYFQWLGNAEIQVVFFSNQASRPKSGFLVDGNWSAMRALIENTPFDGGTQLGCLDLSQYPADEHILISDGISNFGKHLPQLGKSILYVINSSQNGEHALLRHLAEQSGGSYLNLNRLSTPQALQSLSNSPYRLISMEYDSQIITELYPSAQILDQADFSLLGKTSGKPTKIQLNFGIGQKVLDSRTLKLDQDKHMSNSGLIPRLWAQQKLTHLEKDFQRNESQISSLGREWNLVTRNTSLIVLDRLEDYIEHEIVPPQEMQEEYFAAIRERDRDEKQEKEEHLETVIRMFEARVAWYEKDFPKDKPPVAPIGEKSSEGFDDWGEDSMALEEAVVEESVIAGDEADGWADMGDENTEWGSAEEEEPSPDFKKKDKGGRAKAGIQMAAWDPNEPYMDPLKNASEDQLYPVYLEQKAKYGNMPAFFLDAADHFLKQKREEEALRILSNLSEMELESYRLMRILAYKLLQMGYVEEAVVFFREILELRPEEPQSYRDLGLALARAGQTQEAVEKLYYIANYPWDSRFPEVELIAIEEMNAVIAKAKTKPDLSDIEPKLIREMPLDLRVVVTWDADNCDMDLWVTDPNEEKCFYQHKDTYQGGKMSKDFTGGYGPEEYLLKSAKPGAYKVQVKYYGSRQQDLAGATTIQVQMFTNFGTKKEQVKEVTLRLKNVKEVLDIGELLVD